MDGLGRVHPLLVLAGQKGVLAVLLGFTSATSIVRFAVVPLVLLADYAVLPSFQLHLTRASYIGLLAAETLSGPLDYIEKLLLSQWTFEDYGPSAEVRKRRAITPATATTTGTTTESNVARKPAADVNGPGAWIKAKDTILNRIKFGVWVAASNRYIASPFQAQNTPSYSTTDPTYIPTRTEFLLDQLRVCMTCFLVTDAFTYNAPTGQNHITFAASQVPFFSRLSEVTADEVITRVTTTFGFWINTPLLLKLYFAIFAFGTVALGLATPADWRPAYGSFSSVNSLRTFWGIWWHQMLRKKLTKPSRYLAFNILGLPRPSAPQSTACRLFTRYLQLFAVFALSGLYHQFHEVARGRRLAEGGALRFWMLMACGIVVEDFFQWMVQPWRGVTSNAAAAAGSSAGRSKGEMKWTSRLVGYIWLALFYCWATPVWVYPMLRVNASREQADPLPFSLLRWIRDHVSLTDQGALYGV